MPDLSRLRHRTHGWHGVLEGAVALVAQHVRPTERKTRKRAACQVVNIETVGLTVVTCVVKAPLS